MRDDFPKIGQVSIQDLQSRTQDLEREYGVLLVQLSIRQVLQALALLERHALDPALVAGMAREVRDVIASLVRYRTDVEQARRNAR